MRTPVLRNAMNSHGSRDPSMLSAAVLTKPARIGIVGAGVVGLSCAFFLQRIGHQVDILDPRPPGEGASLGNAGIIAISEVFPVGRPAMLRQVPRMLFDPTGPLVIKWAYAPSIAPWLIRLIVASRPVEVARISRALASLLGIATETWRELVRACQSEARLVANGWLRVMLTEHHLKTAIRDAELQRELGVRVDILHATDIQEIEPALATGFAGAAFFPDAGNLTTPLGMMRTLAAHLTQKGVAIERRDVKRIEVADNRAKVVDSVGMRTTYDRVIVAAGAWSRSLVRTLGVDVPLDTERGYHVMLPTPARTLQRPVSFPAPGYTLVQMEDGVRLTTGVEFAGLNAPPDLRRVRRLVKHAQESLPGLASSATSEWLGFRPSMPRSMPVIGPVPQSPQVILAFGHGHLGMTLGPATGRLVAAIVSGQPAPIDVTPFLPS
jgi:D-amino-acid dehydrogenase